jgi:glycosyltransferase involved in cell wall biosynthesis
MQVSHNKPRVAFSVTNCICYDQRVRKIAGTVSDIGYDVTIIGRHLGDCCDSTRLPFRTNRFRMIFRRGFLFYKFINIRFFFYLLFHRFDLLVANDLDTLLPNFLIARLKRIPLVYDSHEYFTGVPEIQDRKFVKGVWSLIERTIFPGLKLVMTVSDCIATQYEKEYGIRPVVIRNCSVSSSDISPFKRSDLGISDDTLLLILQGGGINIDRGGEELIDAVVRTENVFLIIAGSGDVINILKEKVSASNASGKIKFTGKLPWSEMMRYTKMADAGLSLDRDSNLNYRFSLPNKLFDYISAGIPVIAGDLPEVKKIIDGYNCGIIIPAVTPDEIANAITALRDDREMLNKLRTNAVTACEMLNWDIESGGITEFYSKIFPL